MKRFFRSIRNFFLPPADKRTFLRILPLLTVAVLMIVLWLGANFAWEETNSPSFCGLTCHTMPPQYATYQHSAHTNVLCEDCHMGRDRFFVLLPRKIRYSWQTGSAMVFNTYEYPIIAKNMAPAREACENCHKPEVFANDTLVEIKRFAEDQTNSASSTFLVVKTGGGTEREGLGYGIHWHVENKVEYWATDSTDQVIPYVKVTHTDGSVTEYIDVENSYTTESFKSVSLTTMDCISCHNRTAHGITSPESTMDELLTRNLVSAEIPFIKKKGVEVLSATYETDQAALDAIAGLSSFYNTEESAYYKQNAETVDQAVLAIQDAWKRTNFIDQKMDWTTHPDNMAHKDTPGCFRCHDGKHMTSENVAIRLECNICHSIPVVSNTGQLTTNLELSKGFEPESHKNPNWIALHRDTFDISCQGCHTVEDAGGSSNTSFCSNSACHGYSWKFAGFDAPQLREILGSMATPTPEPAPAATPVPSSGPVTFEQVGELFKTRCGACHGTTGMKGLNILTYATLMAGSENGPVIIPGDPDNSLVVKVQTAATPHFGQFTADELASVKQWILDGALEK
jgi:nitrate/TMAO reductase-like tetraheme cytochrome c subunit